MFTYHSCHCKLSTFCAHCDSQVPPLNRGLITGTICVYLLYSASSKFSNELMVHMLVLGFLYIIFRLFLFPSFPLGLSLSCVPGLFFLGSLFVLFCPVLLCCVLCISLVVGLVLGSHHPLSLVASPCRGFAFLALLYFALPCLAEPYPDLPCSLCRATFLLIMAVRPLMTCPPCSRRMLHI